MPKKKVGPKRVLVLRTCDKNMKSFGGFQWPKSGRVEAPDWETTKKCGNGLHGLKEGRGDGSYLSWEESAIWQAVWVQEDLILELDGKCKFPWCEVACVGDRKTVTDFMAANGCVEGVVGGTATAGNGGTATAGYRGTATAGDGGTATAGDWGTATAGYRGTATAGYRGTATAGSRGTATAGNWGTATAGNGGTATAGNGGTATAGDWGTATAGDWGTATAGNRGTATAGNGGTATAGDGGILNIRYSDGKRYRVAVFYVGEDGIEPNVAYGADNSGKPIKKEK